jgi:hypothetical protein
VRWSHSQARIDGLRVHGG